MVFETHKFIRFQDFIIDCYSYWSMNQHFQQMKHTLTNIWRKLQTLALKSKMFIQATLLSTQLWCWQEHGQCKHNQGMQPWDQFWVHVTVSLTSKIVSGIVHDNTLPRYFMAMSIFECTPSRIKCSWIFLGMSWVPFCSILTLCKAIAYHYRMNSRYLILWSVLFGNIILSNLQSYSILTNSGI